MANGFLEPTGDHLAILHVTALEALERLGVIGGTNPDPKGPTPFIHR